MRTDHRLQRVLRLRQLDGGMLAAAQTHVDGSSMLLNDAKLFAMTFAAGFLFTTIFIA